MKTPTAPAAPDPVTTASAQSGVNRDTALTQQQINMIDQYTPQGSLTYNKVGDSEMVDSLTGKPYSVPRYSATQTLSPEQQALYNQSTQFDSKFNDIALQQTDKIGGLLAQPLDLNNLETEGMLYDLGRKRLDPRFQQQRQALETDLANRGVYSGSEAYNRAFDQFGQQENDAYNQLALTGRGQAVQEALTGRSQPINEITALMNGGQVSQPNFINAPQTQLAGTDYQGAVAQKYAGDMNAYNQKVAGQNSLVGGLLGGIGNVTGFGIAKSDRRIKDDITKISTLENGLPVYTFRYKGSPQFHIGLMAQDVQKVKPASVMSFNGVLAVNYLTAVEAA
jgi:hypothetical protein